MSDIDGMMREVRGSRRGYDTGGAAMATPGSAPGGVSGVDPAMLTASIVGANPAVSAVPPAAAPMQKAPAAPAPAPGDRPIYSPHANAPSAYDIHGDTVRNAYRDYLGRDADDVGLRYWSEQLARPDYKYTDLARDFGMSDEARGNANSLIGGYYRNEYGRDARQDEIDAALARYRNNVGLHTIRDDLNYSDEGRLHDAYQDVFGRVPDAIGRDYWLNQKSNGMSDQEVADMLWNSQEARNRHSRNDAGGGPSGMDREKSWYDKYAKDPVIGLRDALFSEAGKFYGRDNQDFEWGKILDVLNNRSTTGWDQFKGGWKGVADINTPIGQLLAPKQFSHFAEQRAGEAEAYFQKHPEAAAKYEEFIRKYYQDIANGSRENSGALSYLNHDLAHPYWARNGGRGGFYKMPEYDRPGEHHEAFGYISPSGDNYTERAKRYSVALAQAILAGRPGLTPEELRAIDARYEAAAQGATQPQAGGGSTPNFPSYEGTTPLPDTRTNLGDYTGGNGSVSTPHPGTVHSSGGHPTHGGAHPVHGGSHPVSGGHTGHAGHITSGGNAIHTSSPHGGMSGDVGFLGTGHYPAGGDFGLYAGSHGFGHSTVGHNTHHGGSHSGTHNWSHDMLIGQNPYGDLPSYRSGGRVGRALGGGGSVRESMSRMGLFEDE